MFKQLFILFSLNNLNKKVTVKLDILQIKGGSRI